MANPEHLAILKQGVEVWNAWREQNPAVEVDLSGADLYEMILPDADLSGANLIGVDLSYAVLKECHMYRSDLGAARVVKADLTGADLYGAKFHQTTFYGSNLTKTNLKKTFMSWTDLREANLSEADVTDSDLSNADLESTVLTGANLTQSTLFQSNLSHSDLRNSNLTRASLVQTKFINANLSGCRVFGISAWNVDLQGADQTALIITSENEPTVTVDNLEVAQFIYLILNNSKLRGVIDTLTTKSVLILGRFTEERKAVLDAIRDALRQRGYLPILFDFERPANRDLTETVLTLAGMSRFVIADLSDPNSIPHELMSFAEKLLSVPVQGIFCPVKGHAHPYPMYEHLRRYPHVLPIHRYETLDKLIADLNEKVISPAERKVFEVRPR